MNDNENDKPVPFHTTFYRHDISQWGGKSFYDANLNLKTRSIQSEKSRGFSSNSINRCIKSINTRCRPVTTPTSLYRDSYCKNVQSSTTNNNLANTRLPTTPLKPPDPPDPSIMRPSTEYRDRYRRPVQTIHENTISWCPQVRTRSDLQSNQYSPRWSTSYRQQFCERATSTTYSPAITFHNTTHRR